jgi:hypothetical protein
MQDASPKGGTVKNSVRKTRISGTRYTQHYDRHARPTQRTERKTQIGGNTYTQHYDKSGRPFKRSK